MHELCLHLIGFVENLYRSWKNIKSPINQQKICIFSLIIKATTLIRNTCIEHRFHHPHFLHPGHRMYITNHKLFINVHYFLSKFCLLITFIWLIRNLGEGRGVTFADALFIAHFDFRKRETRGVWHNPIDCTAVKLNVFYLNKLWKGLAKPGMTLSKESKLITEYGSMW